MAEATRSQIRSDEPGGRAANVAKDVRAARLMTTGSSTIPVPEAWPFEGTIGAAASSYDPPFFAGELAAILALRRWPESDQAAFDVPFYIEPKEVPGYRVLEGDPITRVVSLPKGVAIWGQESWPHLTLRQHFAPGGRSSRTVISLVKLPASFRLQPSGHQALEDLSRSMGLSHEALGDLIGASRRSVYNWLRGRAMSSQFETRAVRLRTVLRPLADRRAPGEIATWLQSGATPPAELLREERWGDVEALVQQELKPRVLEPMPAEPERGAAETYSATTRRAVLASLRRSPAVGQRRRPDWRPREITGTAALADDEAE
jgi:hypothetical protein